MTMSLQDLRKGAGYRTAKEFAEALGVPTTTYSRYEATPEKIPLSSAWAIADFLGCTIDEVVGHEAAGTAGGEWQMFYEGLSDEGKELMADLRAAVARQEERRASRAQGAEESRNDVMLRHYEKIFYAQSDEGAGFGDLAFASDVETRRAFREFLEERARSARGAGSREGQQSSDEEVIAGIMGAYDRAHGTAPDE